MGGVQKKMAYLEDSIRNTSELSSTLKLFLHTLASYADPEGVCFPAQRTIAHAMSMSIATVQRCLAESVELKFLEVRRRWRKSNVYRLLCVKKPSLSTTTSFNEAREQPPLVIKNVNNAVDKPAPKKWVSPKEIGILLQDIEETLGKGLLEQNKGFYVRIIRSAAASYELIQDALRFVKCAILESQLTGNLVTNPSGLFWWKLKEAGVRI
jgi:Helix-turn-helix domain